MQMLQYKNCSGLFFILFYFKISDHVETFSMEDKLRSLGILGGTDEQKNLSYASIIDGTDLEAYLPPKKVYLLSGCSVLWRVLQPTDAFL